MKKFLAVFVICSVVICCQAAVKGFSERIECFRGIQSRIYENRIKELVENLKQQLKEGIPDKNIPPLDPFILNNWNLKINEDFAKLDWTMDGSIKGLMSWDLAKITFSIAGFKFTFEVVVPEIEGEGKYKIDGSLVDVLPIYGAGDFNVLAQNVIISGSGKIGSRGSGENQTLFLEKFEIRPSLEKFTFAVTGLMEDDSLSFLLSQMISESLPDLVTNYQSMINGVVSPKVTAAADKVLGTMTMKDILDLLKPKPKPDAYSQYIIDCGGY